MFGHQTSVYLRRLDRHRDGFVWHERRHRDVRPRQAVEVQQDRLRVLDLGVRDVDRGVLGGATRMPPSLHRGQLD